jgi:WD40 repeat protein
LYQGFARDLNSALQKLQRDTWIDWRRIPDSAEWRAEIFAGIDAADNFLFIISPDSLRSHMESGRELRTLSGHTNFVEDVTVTRDGLAVSASADRTLKLWDLSSGQELRTLSGHSGAVNAVAVTPDGKRAVSASDDKTLRLWDLSSGQELRTLKGHTDTVWAVAVTPDGNRAVSVSSDGTLKVWDLADGRELRSLNDDPNSLTDCRPDTFTQTTCSLSGFLLQSGGGPYNSASVTLCTSLSAILSVTCAIAMLRQL